jgi:hypothetical protein
MRLAAYRTIHIRFYQRVWVWQAGWLGCARFDTRAQTLALHAGHTSAWRVLAYTRVTHRAQRHTLAVSRHTETAGWPQRIPNATPSSTHKHLHLGPPSPPRALCKANLLVVAYPWLGQYAELTLATISLNLSWHASPSLARRWVVTSLARRRVVTSRARR